MGWILTGCGLLQPPEYIPGTPALVLKLITNESGIHSVDKNDLASFGISFQDLVNNGYHLTRHGVDWSSWLVGDPDRLIFYAPGSDNLYSREDVFLLELGIGNGQSSFDSLTVINNNRFELTASQLSSVQDYYIESTRWEENKIYRPQVTDSDHWLWQTMVAPGKVSLDIYASDVFYPPNMTDISKAESAEQDTQVDIQPFLRLAFWAITEAIPNPDHLVKIKLNETSLGEFTYEGQGRWFVEAHIPPEVLAPGQNQLSLEFPGLIDVPADLVALDWIELYYARRLVAQDDHLAFTGAGLPCQVSGFSGPVDIFAIQEDNQARWLAHGLLPGEYWKADDGQYYLVVGTKGIKAISRIEPAATEPDLKIPASRGYEGADYLIVGSSEFSDELEPLMTLRRSQGLQTQFISLAAIYDQFNGGQKAPQGIRAFLQYATQFWQPSPRYLLLVGDATYDPRGYISSPPPNQLPVFMIQTRYGGQTGSDYGYGMLTGSDWPMFQSSGRAPLEDELIIAVGRLPARQPDEVKAWVKKVLAYERDVNSNTWQQNVLAIADGSNPQFSLAAQLFLKWFPKNAKKKMITSGDQSSSETLRNALNESVWVVGYFGHGSVTAWGKDQIFSVEDVTQLKGEYQPSIFIQMTCLTGLFTHPEITSLTEKLIWQSGGAVAALAPTSLSLPLDHHLLVQAVTSNLFDSKNTRIGDAFRNALQELPADDPGLQEVMKTFLLFGDPAMKLPGR